MLKFEMKLKILLLLSHKIKKWKEQNAKNLELRYIDDLVTDGRFHSQV